MISRFPPIVVGDTPSFASTVYANGSALNCTGYTLKFIFRGPDDTAQQERACTWVVEASGTFTLKFETTDLDHAGDWQGHFQLTKDSDIVHDYDRFVFPVIPAL